jgi:hypothetical protein
MTNLLEPDVVQDTCPYRLDSSNSIDWHAPAILTASWWRRSHHRHLTPNKAPRSRLSVAACRSRRSISASTAAVNGPMHRHTVRFMNDLSAIPA